jgi:hypothetical protein
MTGYAAVFMLGSNPVLLYSCASLRSDNLLLAEDEFRRALWGVFQTQIVDKNAAVVNKPFGIREKETNYRMLRIDNNS